MLAWRDCCFRAAETIRHTKIRFGTSAELAFLRKFSSRTTTNSAHAGIAARGVARSSSATPPSLKTMPSFLRF